MNSKTKIIFMGTSAFAETILSSLIEEKFIILSVFTQPPKKVGRRHILQKSRVHLLAEKNNLPIAMPYKIDEEIIREVESQNPDLIIVAAYGKILPEKLLIIPRFGSLNVHASLLPKFRGPSPIQNAILAGEKETGITIMLMDKGVDTGEIISQRKIRIGGKETALELSEHLAKIGSELLIETLPKWIAGKIKAEPQDNSLATLCQLVEREDGHIVWSEDAETIFNKFRALQPWPGIFTFWEKNGQSLRLKINKINLIKDDLDENFHIGEVIKIDSRIGIKTGRGIIFPEKVQPEGKLEMSICEFINGQKTFVGSILK
ncbi:MAG: methionyl-tRNA formyltransferase [Candidatus Moranbacteria bacterium]|nr:methionyl-tRNA formyltransferase [Candidatus Moranbacteria bacterium]